MALWNCNGSLRLNVVAFEDSFKGQDIIFYSETHQAPGQEMPQVAGFAWETTFRPKARSERGTRGSGGIAILFRQELQSCIRIVRRDEQARYMWVQLRAETGRHIYIAVCYFAPSNSLYVAPRELNPYSDLNDDILEFLADGDDGERTQNQNCLYSYSPLTLGITNKPQEHQ